MEDISFRGSGGMKMNVEAKTYTAAKSKVMLNACCDHACMGDLYHGTQLMSLSFARVSSV